MKHSFNIKARDMSICKPDGMEITFWLYAEDEDALRVILKNKGFRDIKWIKKLDLEKHLEGE
jgi:hypothetical protein